MSQMDRDIQERVDLLFDRFGRMTDAEFMMLRTVWDQQDPVARGDAWTLLKVALRTSRRERMLDDARNRMAAWLNNYPPRGTFPDATGQMSLSGMDQATVRKEAFPPMLDAIAATIAADGLSLDEQTLLLEPVAALAPHNPTA